MEKITLRKYPDPVLRKRCQEVEKITPEILLLIEEMKKILDQANGAGLAANQAGELRRIIIINTEKGPLELINPEITRKSVETEVIEEGCLSFPGLWLKIKRAKEVEIQAKDSENREIKLSAKGIQARGLQHEIDHLDGVLFISRIGFFQRLRLNERLKKFTKDKN